MSAATSNRDLTGTKPNATQPTCDGRSEQYRVIIITDFVILVFCWFSLAGSSGHAVCGRSPAEIVGSNLTGGMDVVSVVCCQVEISATG